MSRTPEAVRWDGTRLHLLDQRRLPETVAVDAYTNGESVRRAIVEMRVRGAPAIGIAAAYGLVLAMEPHRRASAAAFAGALANAKASLRAARPTAVNLAWALDRVAAAAEGPLAGGSAPYRVIGTRFTSKEVVATRDEAGGISFLDPGYYLAEKGRGRRLLPGEVPGAGEAAEGARKLLEDDVGSISLQTFPLRMEAK